MNEFINVSSFYSIQPAARSATAVPSTSTLSPDHRVMEDVVEFSGLGRMLARASEESSYRIARVRAIRAEIENGTYETPQRIQGTVTRLLDVLG